MAELPDRGDDVDAGGRRAAGVDDDKAVGLFDDFDIALIGCVCRYWALDEMNVRRDLSLSFPAMYATF